MSHTLSRPNESYNLRQFSNRVDRQLNQVKSGLQQVDADEIKAFKREHNEEDLEDEELVNSNSPEEM